MSAFKMTVFGALILGVSGCVQDDLSSARSRTDGETFVVVRSATWVDPDGCEHWVFDTGAEGFMTPKLRPNGLPICDPSLAENTVLARAPGFGLVEETDRMNFVLDAGAAFPVGSAVLQTQATNDLQDFFGSLRTRGVSRVLVSGHTDADGGAQSNMNLSLARAAAVAQLAAEYGITAETRGLGETQPVMSNATAAGRTANRRVEIQVVN